MAEVVIDGVSRVLRHRGWLALASTPWAVGLMLVLGALVSGDPRPLIPVGHLGIFGTIAMVYALQRNKSPRLAPGALRITDREIYVGGERVCARSDVKSALLVPKDGRLLVRLSLRGRPLVPTFLAVDSEETGRSVLRALGFDASQTVAEVRGLSPFFALDPKLQIVLPLLPVLLAGAGVGLGAALIGPSAALVAAPLFVVTVLVMLLSLVWPSRLTIGADGLFSAWLWHRKSFRFADVVAIEPVHRRVLNKVYLGLSLTLASGATEFLPLGQKGWGDDELGAATERIRNALDVYRAGAITRAASIEPLLRRGRAAREWLSSLRRLGTEASADHRAQLVSTEQLTQLVQDASAKPDVRAGAAVALAARADEDGRARIRVALESTAEPKLRVALEKAADASAADDELASALEALSEERDASVDQRRR